MGQPQDDRDLAAGEVSESSPLEDPQVIQALCQYREALEAGRPIRRRAVLNKFPQIRDELCDCLDALDVMQDVAASFRDGDRDGSDDTDVRNAPDSLNRVGDFRLIRMIGRGGMGVVYEAEQESLRRRVALKILPTSVVLDPTNLRRFKIESQAAASLDHPNIVSIYSVGCEGGVHYYAMQYVHGQTLDRIIRRLRDESHAERNTASAGRNGRQSGSAPAAGADLGSPRAATPRGAAMPETTIHAAPGEIKDRQAHLDFALRDPTSPTCAGQTTSGHSPAAWEVAGADTATANEAPVSFSFPSSIRDPEYFRAAAGLGIQGNRTVSQFPNSTSCK